MITETVKYRERHIAEIPEIVVLLHHPFGHAIKMLISSKGQSLRPLIAKNKGLRGKI